ncbi:MAG: hypothetical protein V1709_08980 [Planctomycetota bacterium]
MSSFSLRILLILFVALSLNVAVAQEEQETVVTGNYYRIHCHFKNEQIASEALKTAEIVYPIVAKIFNAKTDKLNNPLEIHLYRTESDYRAIEKKITGGKFAENGCFSMPTTKTSHIALSPTCSDATLRAVGLPLLTRRLIAHEGCHLAQYAILPGGLECPDWFKEGLVMWMADLVIAKLGLNLPFEQDPENSKSILDCQELLENGSLPNTNMIIKDELGAVKDMHYFYKYGVWELFFHFLKEGKYSNSFESIMRDVRRFGGGTNSYKNLIKHFEESFNKEIFKTLNKDFIDYLKSLKPEWRQEYRSLDTHGKEWIQIAFEDTNAVAFKTNPVGK